MTHYAMNITGWLVSMDQPPNVRPELVGEVLSKSLREIPNFVVTATGGVQEVVVDRVFHCPGCGHKQHELKETLEVKPVVTLHSPPRGPMQSDCAQEHPDPGSAKTQDKLWPDLKKAKEEQTEPHPYWSESACPREVREKCDHHYANHCSQSRFYTGPCQCACHKLAHGPQ